MLPYKMAFYNNNCLRKNPFILIIILLLSGCNNVPFYEGFYNSTPTIKKHAKRGYNKPYRIKGRKYYPRNFYEYSEVGIASFYGERYGFHGSPTSTGEIFNKDGLTAAHKTLPLPSVVRVTNLENRKSIVLRINDRGPFAKARIIDLSEKAAKYLGFYNKGLAKVKVDCLVGESTRLAHIYKPLSCSPYNVRCSNRTTYKHPKNIKKSKKITSKLKKYVQVAVYKSANQANKFAHKVATRLRVNCKHYRSKTGKKIHYRVLIGPIPNNATYAKKLLKILYDRNVKDAFVVTAK